MSFFRSRRVSSPLAFATEETLRQQAATKKKLLIDEI